ncbi:hypothetical protein MNBD_GAMMA04-23 [hydrothermal vent metagenome]|uniref:Amine oxidase domain-containing protein n=1 Tax=hydrothermal vent metagenome TaxID=652676 RepID=A0A3B0WKE5_9ZZZZ
MKHVVVGSGIVGLLIARGLQAFGKKVVLIEAQDEIGGLLGKSYEYKGLRFDYGTHLVPTTGNVDLDELILGKKLKYTKDWVRLPVIKSGNFTNGWFNTQSPYIDLHCLNKKKYAQVCVEMLNAKESKKDINTLREQLETSFGKVVTQTIYAPALNKLFGVGISSLIKDAYRIFIPPRVILGSPMVNQALKQSSYFDEKLAYSSVDESRHLSCMHFYPRKNGVFDWVLKMQKTFLKQGGELYKSTTLSQLKPSKKGIKCTFSNGQKINADSLWWTASPLLLFSLLGKTVKLKKRVSFRQTHLVHFVFNQKFLTDVSFFTCFDPDFQSFRVTLYPCIHKTSDDMFHCTVEVLNQLKKMDKSILIADIEEELKKMGAVSRKAKKIHATVQSLGNTFPVKDVAFREMVQKIKQIEQTLPNNIHLEGVAKGHSFFMRDVLLDAYKALKKSVKNKE